MGEQTPKPPTGRPSRVWAGLAHAQAGNVKAIGVST